MGITSTQIGAIAENIVANALIIASDGRLSPFSPVADDDGIDLLVYDKQSGRALPAQVKSRTVALKRRGTQIRGSVVHFEVRAATFRAQRYGCVILVLLAEDATAIERAWVIPMAELLRCAAPRGEKYVVRASKSLESVDKFSCYQCKDAAALVGRVMRLIEAAPAPAAG